MAPFIVGHQQPGENQNRDDNEDEFHWAKKGNCYRNYTGWRDEERRTDQHSHRNLAPMHYPQYLRFIPASGEPGLRIVLSNIGTYGDVNPLIAIAQELKRRGHAPVMALPNVYREKIKPLGLEFRELRPDIDPTNTKLVEMIYDVKKGTETGLREFLFPVLRQTYADLLDAATQPARADLLLLGELNYAGPIVAEATGIPWASYVLAPFSFFSAFDPPVLPPYPKLARADKAPGMGRAMRRLARFVTRKWPEPIYELRRELGLPKGRNPIFDAKHSPDLVLALFSHVLGTEQKDWPENTLIAGFCFYDADAGNAALPAKLEEFLAADEPPIVFTLGSAAVLAAGDFYEQSARAVKKLGVRAVLLVGSDPRNDPRKEPGNGPQQELPDSICVAEYAPYSGLFPRAALVVHQGGVGTTAQCLRAGRPMLIMPYSHDQPDNARRMRRMGVARVIQRSQYMPWRVARRVRAMLADPEYAEQAQKAAEEVARENGVKTACDALEQLQARTHAVNR
jgi:MGT family glycosyltransferase